MSKELQKTDQATINRASLDFVNSLLNAAPKESEIKINKLASNSKYLPVSFIEMTLDEIFGGLWQTKNFTSQVVANEIIGTIELGVFHPILREWIWRTGAGAVMIQQKSVENGGSGDITRIADKIKNTLVKDFPHLKAECLKNAARSLGKVFGRDLNRSFEDQYTPFEDTLLRAEASIDAAINEINAANSKDELKALYTKYAKVPGCANAIMEKRKTL